MKILSERPWLLITFFLISNLFSSIAVSIGMYLIPWYISNTAGEPVFLANTAMLSALLILFLSPFIGKLIDSFNRKSILTFITIVILVLFLFLALSDDTFLNRLYALIGAYLFIQIYYSVFYNTRQGFIKDIFAESQLYRINAILEIETQSSILLAAALVFFFSTTLTSTDIFLVLAGMAFISLVMLMVIPYTSNVTTGSKNTQAPLPKLSLSFLKTDLFCYMAMGNIPFICIMTINVIQAPFMNDVLLEPIGSYATYGIIYGCGAILVGFIMERLSGRYPQRKLVFIFTSIFAITLGIIATGLVPLIFANNYQHVWNYIFAISLIAPVALLFRRYLDRNLIAIQ